MHLAESDVRVGGRFRVAFTSDSDEMLEVSGAYSEVEMGGWLQASGAPVKVFMVKDPDGNSIAFAQAPDNAALK